MCEHLTLHPTTPSLWAIMPFAFTSRCLLQAHSLNKEGWQQVVNLFITCIYHEYDLWIFVNGYDEILDPACSWCLQDWNSIFSHYTHAIARTMAKAMHVRSMQVQTSFHRMCWEDLGSNVPTCSISDAIPNRIKRCQSESQSICSFNGGLSTTKSDLKEQTVWNSQPVLLYPASC